MVQGMSKYHISQIHDLYVLCRQVLASFPDSTPDPSFISHGVIKSWGVESGNMDRQV